MNGNQLAAAFERYSDHVLDLETRISEVGVIASNLLALLRINAELPDADTTLAKLDALLGVSEPAPELDLNPEERSEIQSRLNSLRDAPVEGGGGFAPSGHQCVEVVYRRKAEVYAVRIRPEYQEFVLGVTSTDDRNEALHECGDDPDKVERLRAQFVNEDRKRQQVLDMADGPTTRDLLKAVLKAGRQVKLEPAWPRSSKKPPGNAKPSQSSQKKQREYTAWVNECGLRHLNQLDLLGEASDDEVEPEIEKARRHFFAMSALEPLLQDLQSSLNGLDHTVGEADEDDVDRLWAGLDEVVAKKAVVEAIGEQRAERGLRVMLLDERRVVLGVGSPVSHTDVRPGWGQAALCSHANIGEDTFRKIRDKAGLPSGVKGETGRLYSPVDLESLIGGAVQVATQKTQAAAMKWQGLLAEIPPETPRLMR